MACRHEEKGWWFTKRMVPHDIIPSCGPHVLEPPPEELFSLYGLPSWKISFVVLVSADLCGECLTPECSVVLCLM